MNLQGSVCKSSWGLPKWLQIPNSRILLSGSWTNGVSPSTPVERSIPPVPSFLETNGHVGVGSSRKT